MMLKNTELKFKNLEEENNLILLQLHQVQEELDQFYAGINIPTKAIKEGPAVKQKIKIIDISKPSESRLYGAADRLKGQLAYRLGSCMIQQSRSIKGWVGMLFALKEVVSEFRRERNQFQPQKLAPIETYADAYEAENTKHHLSYRLGASMIYYSRTPWGWVFMPWALVKAVIEFRKGVFSPLKLENNSALKRWRLSYLVPGVRENELLREDKFRLDAQIRKLTKSLKGKETLEQKLAESEKERIELEGQHAKRTAERDGLIKEKETLEHQNKNIKVEMATLVNLLENECNAFVKCEKERIELEGQHAKRTAERDGLIKEKETLEQKLAESEKERIELEGQHAKRTAERDGLINEKETLEKSISKLEGTTAQQSDHNQKMEIEITKAEAKLQMLKEFIYFTSESPLSSVASSK